MRQLAIAIHDVSPATMAESQALVRLIQSVVGGHARLTLLVVPHYHRKTRIDRCPSFRRWVDARVDRGDELALHGMWHVDDSPLRKDPISYVRRRVLTDREGEFSDLSSEGARQRIDMGLALFQACGWSASGFVPPAWQLNAPSTALMHEYRFGYYTTRAALVLPEQGRAACIPALSLSARTKFRRALSIRWARQWMSWHRDAPAWRFALHPVDARFDDMWHTWRRCVEVATADSVLVTKQQLSIQ